MAPPSSTARGGRAAHQHPQSDERQSSKESAAPNGTETRTNGTSKEAENGAGLPIASYKVYLNSTPRSIMILRFPNRSREIPYNKQTGQKPTAIRIKPKAGLVEVDIPMITSSKHYDQDKSRDFADALKESAVLARGGGYGLTGGFNAGNRGGRVRMESSESEGEGEEEDEDENEPRRFGRFRQAERTGTGGNILSTLCFSGQIHRVKEGEPVYYIGVFRDKELHLTRVTTFVDLRPSFQHLDAISDLERTSTRRAAGYGEGGGESEARAVNMAVKMVGTDDDNELDSSDLRTLLRLAEEEPWQTLDWIDEDDNGAYAVFESELFFGGKQDKDKGLRHSQMNNTLVTSMSAAQYLDAISAPRLDPAHGLAVKTMRRRTYSNAGSSCPESTDDEDQGLQDGEEIVVEERRHKKL